MMKHNTMPLVVEILTRAAPLVGARIATESVWRVAGQITFASGRRRYFRDTSLDINPMGAAAIAKDKDYANFFMKAMGYPTIQGRVFFSRGWARLFDPTLNVDAAWRYAQELGLPVVVKPNSGTGGIGVAMVHSKRAFHDAMSVIFREDDVALVQHVVTGRDYRMVVFDDLVVAAYERIPLNVVGDGCASVGTLLDEKIERARASDRRVNVECNDTRIAVKLRRQRLTLASVPALGERVFLLDNANLSSGGDSIDVSANVDPGFTELAVKLTSDMGLRLCGVDLMVDGLLSEAPKKYWVVEINSAPRLDHYAEMGANQRRVVEKLYADILRALAD